MRKGLHVVEGLRASSFLMNVAALIEEDDSVHLIDCGVPGSTERILEYLHERVRNPRVRTLILTHFDSDHAGSASELKRKTGCEIVAHEFDARVVSGGRFSSEELQRILGYSLEEAEALRVKIDGQEIPKVSADTLLHGGEILAIGNRANLIHVPGHTPGHLVIHLPEHSALVSGDALSVHNGRIGPPSPQFTPAPVRAIQSLKKLVELEYDILVPYHSPPIAPRASFAVSKYLKTLD